MQEPIRLLLVDDHHVVLHGLCEFFGTQPDLIVVAEATDGRTALERVRTAEPDVALIDLRLPDIDGITLCRELRNARPELVCLILSSFGDDKAVVDAMLAGAAGYVLKDEPLPRVVDAIRQVAGGGSIIDPALTRMVLDRLSGAADGPRIQDLTGQERRVLDLIAEGLTNREIAERLFLAEQTVKNYVSSLLSKLGVKGRTQAATLAREQDRRSFPGSG